jgi:hypothetical protein
MLLAKIEQPLRGMYCLGKAAPTRCPRPAATMSAMVLGDFSMGLIGSDNKSQLLLLEVVKATIYFEYVRYVVILTFPPLAANLVFSHH